MSIVDCSWIPRVERRRKVTGNLLILLSTSVEGSWKKRGKNVERIAFKIMILFNKFLPVSVLPYCFFLKPLFSLRATATRS